LNPWTRENPEYIVFDQNGMSVQENYKLTYSSKTVASTTTSTTTESTTSTTSTTSLTTTTECICSGSSRIGDLFFMLVAFLIIFFQKNIM